MGENPYFREAYDKKPTASNWASYQASGPQPGTGGPGIEGSGYSPGSAMAPKTPGAIPTPQQAVGSKKTTDWKSPVGLSANERAYNEMIARYSADINANAGYVRAQPTAPYQAPASPDYSSQPGDTISPRSYGGGGGGGPFRPQLGPTPEIDLSSISLDLPDYEPPQEDESVRMQAREKSYQRGRGDLQEATHNAIISAKSLDNPAARSQFVGNVLRSMGASLTQISAAAGREGDAEARRQRADQMQIYNAKHQAASTEAMAAYDRDLNEAMTNFGAEQYKWQQGQGEEGGGTGWVSGLRAGMKPEAYRI